MSTLNSLAFYARGLFDRDGWMWRTLRDADARWRLPFGGDEGVATDSYIVDRNPLILLTHWQAHHLKVLSTVLRGRRAYILFFLWWTHESESRLRILKRTYDAHRESCPEHNIIFLCNTAQESALCERHGIPQVYCNQNSLLDEARYRPFPEVEKQYDAIYNARLEIFKRHRLARKIESLALLTYGLERVPASYVRHVRHTLPHAHWCNFEDGSYRLVPRSEIARYLSAAKVGLCLSAQEGAMYASAEYLLSGLPIVSTRSTGGRDVFFDAEYVAIVDDTPEEVRRGVQRMCSLRLPAEYIRNKTLEKFRPHRERFVATIQRIYDEEGVRKNFELEFRRLYIDRMLEWRSWSDIA